MANSPQASVRGAVRITLPASVAANLGQFHKSMENLAERIGCGTCFSGADCTFQVERDFLIDEKLELRAVPRAGQGTELAAPAVTVAAPVGGRLEALKATVASLAGRLGHVTCCSGFDITFRQQFVVDPGPDQKATATLSNAVLHA